MCGGDVKLLCKPEHSITYSQPPTRVTLSQSAWGLQVVMGTPNAAQVKNRIKGTTHKEYLRSGGVADVYICIDIDMYTDIHTEGERKR